MFLCRTYRLKTEPIASASRTRCECCASAPSTAWKRKFWQLPSINWMWTRKSSRPACSIRNPPATSGGPSCRPSWSTRSKTRSGVKSLWMCVPAPAHLHPELLLLRLPTCVCCFQEEDEVPDDETVNQMIARSEEEFEQFMVSLWVRIRTLTLSQEIFN